MSLHSEASLQILHQLHPLAYLGLLLLLSYLGGEAATYLGAPRVTGYLVVGMLLSPSVLGLFHEKLVREELTLVTHIALGIIAFSIGGSLKLPMLQRLGRHILWITVTQGIGAFLITTVVLAIFFPVLHGNGPTASSFWSLHFPMALVVGAISAATAPGEVLAIVHQYRARGTLTTILLGVVALDDALTIFFYAFAASVAHSLINGEALAVQNLVLAPVFSVGISLAIGGALGVALRNLIRFVPRREAMLGLMVGLIFLASGLAMSLDVSPLLANMMLGFTVANWVGQHKELFALVESTEEPLFGMFFTLAGAHLDLGVIQTAGWLAVLIVIGRFSGKLLGTRIGAEISHAPATVKKYLGVALLPKAGVTVGLVLAAKGLFGDSNLAEVMVSGVLGSVIINALIAPLLLRWALFRAGEATRP